jgi:hypothetical protein
VNAGQWQQTALGIIAQRKKTLARVRVFLCGTVMQALSIRQNDRIAKQKLLLIRQQTLVAELFRAGQKERARKAREKLYLLLNKLELLEEETVQNSAVGTERMPLQQELPGQ